MPKSKINIAFILPSLVAGGAERVISTVAQHLDKSRFEATLVIIGFEKDKAYDTSAIKTIYFNKKRVLSGIPKLFNYIATNKPDIVVSCMSHVNIPVAMILTFFPKIKLIIREANIKSITAVYHGSNKSWFFKHALPYSQSRASMIICQSKDMSEEMTSEFKIESSKLCVINNPISDGFESKTREYDESIFNFITVGRLHAEKGHKRILETLSKIEFPFRYTIIGTGEAEADLKQLVNDYKLTSNVTFIPYTNEVQKFLIKSDLFLQGSYAEGFPNALLESCAVGTPALAYQSLGGTNEIIEHGINGYVANDDADFLSYLNKLHQDYHFDKQKVRDSVHKKFNKEKIIVQYQELFFHVMNETIPT
ncbi:glycosyltransferase [Subsaxibacter sp. CAU 1640]|uniref:glycosyltransferase n=1 Tax=Subsaxibacter sp. CAU 1640 TaxID=2933271 RepID=UPI002004E276|nr:glycosyltransferase [Subsaxibacter sp. CAU 1640]MCK7591032.1 glycosyltransferase [Subsaxibacter sp. CAU 1640]